MRPRDGDTLANGRRPIRTKRRPETTTRFRRLYLNTAAAVALMAAMVERAEQS